MSWQLYLSLSVMMFLEYAIWGAWAPVLAARLLGPLKFSGKQTGWIYGTLFLAFIVSPLIAGQLADQWVASQWLLAASQLVGGVLLFVAARKKRFGSLFAVMCLYSLFYAATVPLVNSLMFSHLKDPNSQSPGIFIWAPIAWVLVGLLLTGWRRIKGTGDGSDCLKLAACVSLLMGVFCLFLPDTPPAGAGGDALPFVKAFSMLSDGNFLLFLVLSFVLASQLQFYFLGTAQYLQDIGVQPRNVPAAMSIAQATQTFATLVALGYFVNTLGFRWTLAIGVASWLVMYLVYSMERPRWLVISSMGFHGIAYVLFIIGGQIYVNSVASEDIKSSAQALLFVVTMGFGLFLGTQFTGVVMDRFRAEGGFRWRPIFLVPCVLTAVCAAAFVLFFKG
jgi:nucleoside transporter